MTNTSEPVSELTWWAFIVREGFTAAPLPPTATARPDFELRSPTSCFVEASTLNSSQNGTTKFKAQDGVALDHADILRRVVGKVPHEKQRQLKYAVDHQKPSIICDNLVERRVQDGRIALSVERSDVYDNSLALHPLPLGAFPSLKPLGLSLPAFDSAVDEH